MSKKRISEPKDRSTSHTEVQREKKMKKTENKTEHSRTVEQFQKV